MDSDRTHRALLVLYVDNSACVSGNFHLETLLVIESLLRYALMLVLAVFMAGMIEKLKALWAGKY